MVTRRHPLNVQISSTLINLSVYMYIYKAYFGLLLVASVQGSLSYSHHHDEWGDDGGHAISDLVTPYGYVLEEHQVETSDGYILTLHRIPGREASSLQRTASASNLGLEPQNINLGARKKPVVLLQHGLLDSSAGFLLLGPGRSLALLLVDSGMDVFLANSRGNSYSRKHTSLEVQSPEFWAFSFDDMAK